MKKHGTLILMVKEPIAGRVKTRLGADIGMERAAQLFRLLLRQTLSVASGGHWQVVVAIDPASALHRYKAWSNGWPVTVIPQAKGDLGARLADAIRRAPAGPVVIIGADALGLRRWHIAQAFAALKGHDAVFGPACDGGYWLIGLARRRGADELFRGVRWSSEYALQDTLGNLPASFSTALLDKLRDLDEAQDLKYLGWVSAPAFLPHPSDQGFGVFHRDHGIE